MCSCGMPLEDAEEAETGACRSCYLQEPDPDEFYEDERLAERDWSYR